MIQFSSAVTVAAPARGACSAREWLYKDDHPRRIDRYIDFFGSGAPPEVPEAGEVALGSLA
jgi:hypothetical protein